MNIHHTQLSTRNPELGLSADLSRRSCTKTEALAKAGTMNFQMTVKEHAMKTRTFTTRIVKATIVFIAGLCLMGNVASAYTVSFGDWIAGNDIVPGAIGPGQSFQLVFVTSTATTREDSPGSGTDTHTIAHWNTYVNTVADGSSLTDVPDITWFAAASTISTAANANAVVSSDVYRLDSVLVDTAASFWYDTGSNGGIQNPINIDESGNLKSGVKTWGGGPNYVQNGTIGHALGNGTGLATVGQSDKTGDGFLQSWWSDADGGFRIGPAGSAHFYAISEVISIGAAPELTFNNSSSAAWNVNDWGGGGWQPHANVTFNGPVGTVNVDAATTVGNMTFTNSSPTIGTVGGTHGLGALGDIVIVTDDTSNPVINADIDAGIQKAGAGSLLLNGTVTGDVAVTAGSIGGDGTISGDLTLGNDTQFWFIPGSILKVNGTTVDIGDLSINDLLNTGSLVGGKTYTLIEGSFNLVYANAITNNIGFANAAPLNGRLAYFQEGSLELVVIPEPSTMLLAALGLAGLTLRRRRNR